jgi:hypothetical protein
MDSVETPKAARDALAEGEGEGTMPTLYRLLTMFTAIEVAAASAAAQPPEAVPPEAMRRLLGAIAEAARKGIAEVKAAGGA